MAALFIALSLPDMCIRLAAEAGESTGRARYSAWFDTYMSKFYSHDMGFSSVKHVFMSGKDCYALRCALLHAGDTEIGRQEIKTTLDKIHFSIFGGHCIQVNSALQLNAAVFCGEICSAVEDWLIDFKRDHPEKQQRMDDLAKIHEETFAVGNVLFNASPLG